MLTRVLKFGGKSISDTRHIEEAAQRVKEVIQQGISPIIVMSAFSGATDRMLSAARKLDPDPPVEELDRLMATGEQQAAGLMVLALHRMGFKVRSLSGPEAGIRTNACFGRAHIKNVDSIAISAALSCNEIPVVMGNQGMAPEGGLTTLGRGGSDLSAVALAISADADRVVLYRDVDGIHSADPKLLTPTRHFTQLSFDSMIEMAEAGVPIIHPQALEMARAHCIAMEVRGLQPGGKSTLIDHKSPAPSDPVWSISLSPPICLLTVDRLSRDWELAGQLMALLERTNLRIEGEIQPTHDREQICINLTAPEIEGKGLLTQMKDFLREEPSLAFSLEKRRQRLTLVGKGVGSRKISKSIEKVALQLGSPLATFHSDHHRTFVIEENEAKMWLANLHQELIAEF